jgi:hypothetical protein
MPNGARLTPAEYYRAYRQRARAAGGKDVLVRLPDEVVTWLDELKERQGLRNRSQVLLQLIEQGRAAAQNVT